MDFMRIIQAGGTAMFDTINVKAPRFPAASIWLGNVAGWSSWAAEYLGVPLGPIRLLIAYFSLRAHRARLASIPLGERVYIGASAGILQGLMTAFEQLVKK